MFTRKKKAGPKPAVRYSSQGGNPDEGSQLNALGETRRVAGGRDPATASSERPDLVRHLPMFNGLSLAAKSFHAWQRGLVLAAAFERARERGGRGNSNLQPPDSRGPSGGRLKGPEVSGERRNLKNDLHLEQGLSVLAAGFYRDRRARPVRHGLNHFGERAARI